jgi:hypothetical protein
MTYSVKHTIYATPAYGDRKLVSSIEQTIHDSELKDLIAETVLSASSCLVRESALNYYDALYTNEGRMWMEGTIAWIKNV